MLIGPLRHLVTVERATVSEDAAGAPVKSWSTLEATWAGVEPLTGQERFIAHQSAPDVTHRITLRWSTALAGLSPADRVLYSGRVFDLRAVLNLDERNATIECLATERVR